MKDATTCSKTIGLTRSLLVCLGSLSVACEGPAAKESIEAHSAALNEPSSWAIVDCHDPKNTSYTPFAAGQSNSALKLATVTHTLGGAYNVTFPGLDFGVGG